MHTLSLKLKPSRIYLITVFALIFLSNVVVFTLALSFLIRFMLLVSVNIYAYSLIKTIKLKGQNAVIALYYQKNNWMLTTSSGETQLVSLSDTCYASKVFIVLRFAPKILILSDHRKKLPATWISVIFPDSIGRNKYRSLLALVLYSS